MSAFTRLIFVIFLTDLVYKAAFGKECNGPRQLPISGMMLQRHTYNKRMTRSGYAECLFVCREEKVCQSFNFVISENACEFNNRTKEASPKDFVPNLDRYYVKLDVSRVPLGSIPELPAKSCKEIKANEGQATNGKYWFYSIIPGRAVLAYCDMNTEDIDECRASPAPCHANANCQNNVGSYVCTCRGGFIGDGKTCRDIDECRASPALCHANANCQNNVGSYVCTCRGGFIGDGKSCRDIDECASNVHGCHVKAYCTNTIGSYRCTCKSNYHGNGKYCVYQRGLNGFILNGLSSTYLEKLISFLDPVIQSSSRSRFVRCWRAQTNGWASSTFHSYCDRKGPTVTIIKVGSYIFGGYTDVSWSSSCQWISSSKAFIYSLYNTNEFHPVKRVVKSSHTGYAINSCPDRGPTFGGGRDIFISNNASSNQYSYTYCGSSYLPPPGYSSSGSSCSFYAGSYRFTPTDIEVFYETTS